MPASQSRQDLAASALGRAEEYLLFARTWLDSARIDLLDGHTPSADADLRAAIKSLMNAKACLLTANGCLPRRRKS